MPSNPNPSNEEQQSAPISHFLLDGQGLKKLAEAATAWLKTNQQTVNSLNVFPVPDGDTGTNMVLTMQAALDEVASSNERNAGKMAHAIAHGALMGARGNSGVILSQLWRGFARGLDSFELIDGPNLVRAFSEARDTSYKGVVRPVEGTILTVAKDVAAAAEKALAHTQDPFEILDAVVPAADASVQHTPELLHVLKEAGVVDSGGKGLFYLLEGMTRYCHGQSLETSIGAVPIAAMNLEGVESIEPGQDHEWVIDFRPFEPLDMEAFYQDLEQIGTSIQIGEGDNMYRMHIHVSDEKIYEPMGYIKAKGTVSKAAYENLVEQMKGQQQEPEPGPALAHVEPGQIAAVVVSPGDGLSRVFASLGAAAIVEGGQTMNPSTQDLLQAFENLPTDKIVILPNNKNIILAAQQAAQLSVKKLAVIPSKTMPQGLAAMLRFVADGDFNSVVQEMTSALHDAQSGEITIATRSVEMDGVEVKQGESIALLNGKLVLSAQTLDEAVFGLLEKANVEDFEIITLFYGADLTKAESERIARQIREKYPNQELELQAGGQPHYQLIISIE
jgi:DAK2 domain fusion protein YloV